MHWQFRANALVKLCLKKDMQDLCRAGSNAMTSKTD
jgi:hypothetical protein